MYYKLFVLSEQHKFKVSDTIKMPSRQFCLILQFILLYCLLLAPISGKFFDRSFEGFEIDSVTIASYYYVDILTLLSIGQSASFFNYFFKSVTDEAMIVHNRPPSDNWLCKSVTT